jgi:hypothetical protein
MQYGDNIKKAYKHLIIHMFVLPPYQIVCICLEYDRPALGESVVNGEL